MSNNPMASSRRSRRNFLRTTAAAGAMATAATLGGTTPSTAARRDRGSSVAILGGGVAGLTAAHELVERGFDVTVYERKALGGKARSIPVPGSGGPDREPLPAEHGFRFFPGFYHNVTDNMRRTPFAGNPNGCWDNLVRATSFLGARTERPDITLPFPFPWPPEPFPYSPESLAQTIGSAIGTLFRLPPDEIAFFVEKGLVYVLSSEERRLGQWENISWADYTRAERMSEEYRRLLTDGMIRNLAATKSKNASTHSIGLVGETTLWSVLDFGNEQGASVDRVLDGPTTERWLDPWIQHLRSLGVRFEVGWAAEHLEVSDGAVRSAQLRGPDGQTRTATADWFLSAMPLDRFAGLLNPDLLRADPALESVRKLRTDWMNGLMFYLTEPLPLTPGHVNYIDSGWAITSISQGQFWQSDMRSYGDGRAAECLSSILSDWSSPGMFTPKHAKDCTPEEIARETWEEIKAHVNDTGEQVLRDDMLHSWFLDPAIENSGTPHVTNDEPLFVQNPGSWQDRPDAATGVRNLFLAGDWVRTNVNVTTMEGANQGGRAAANALLDTAGSNASRCDLHQLVAPPAFDQFKELDRDRYREGLPHVFDVIDPRTP